MLDTLKPGQKISCTITAVPRRTDVVQTVERLMRRDLKASKGLRKAQRQRRQGMVIYNRGNRDWVKRELCSKIVHCVEGKSWSMLFTPDLLPEFRNVAKFVTVKAG